MLQNPPCPFLDFFDSSLMVNCSDWEGLNAKYRIVTLRHGRFMNSLKGFDRTDRHEEEAPRLEEEMRETERAWRGIRQSTGAGG